MTFLSQFSLLFLFLFYVFTFQNILCNNLSQLRCNEKDRQTLQIFKEGLIDPSNNLITWSTQQDCCQWQGVYCDNTTSRITKLDLSDQFLQGEIKLSLLELQFLYHLDLSFNFFNDISIPLIQNDVILGSNLHYLDLSVNDISMDNLHWLSQLSSLRYLNLGFTNLGYATNGLESLFMLPSLSELRLSCCRLNITSSLKHVNFTSLVTLDLTGNYFTSKSLGWLLTNFSSGISHLELIGISLSGNFDPKWLSQLHFVKYLDLSAISLSENFDLQWLSELHSVKYLDLSYIDLHKETNWLLAMPASLSDLHLSNCQLTNISPSLKHVNLTSLVTLDLSFNHFNSEMPHWLFNLSRDLSHLDLSHSSLYGEIPSSLFNYQNLEYLDLSGNMFFGSVPLSLGNLTYLDSLIIGYNHFSGAITEMHFSRLHNLEWLDLSNTRFHFSPEWIPLFQLKWLYLDDTNQGPQFPPWIYTQKSLSGLSMSSSKLSFVEKEKFWGFIADIDSKIDISNNSISGDISKVLLKSDTILLNHNNFTGRLPHISPKVECVDLSHNSFTGPIPHGWQNLKYLNFISLRNNDLVGEVLVKLSLSTYLEVIDLEKNEFVGTIPNNMSSYLQVMILRSNKFEGSIPPQLFLLSSLIHLDLAHNKLSGSIPQMTYKTTQMIADNYVKVRVLEDDNIDFYEKGQVYECELDWNRRTIDLSANKISGEIPSELFRLIRVQTLNLSYNNLTGTIPKTIGGMKNLESLDLSNNKLFGEIPENMATLTFLSYLNLSCNNFSGQIPTGTQLQSFNVSSYDGNPELCGDPLKKCNMETNVVNTIENKMKEDGEFDEESLYLGMGVGFAVGFCGLFGSLLIFRKWRHKYYLMLNRMYDQLYVTYMLKFNNFLNREALQ